MRKIIWPIEEWQNRTDYIIWYKFNSSLNYYWLWISTTNIILFRLILFFGNKYRWPSIGLTLFNKSVIDKQRDESKEDRAKRIAKDYIKNLSKADREAFKRLANK